MSGIRNTASRGAKLEFAVVASPGGVKVTTKMRAAGSGSGEQREGRTRSTVGGRDEGTKRGPITGFSVKARSRMRWTLNAYPWEEVPGRLGLLTLTYGSDWPRDGREVQAHLNAVARRWERRYGARPQGVWAKEFQERGAPHFHCYFALPALDEIEFDPVDARHVWDWLSEAWYEIVGSGEQDHRSYGVHVRLSAPEKKRIDGLRVGEYFWRESGKWAQKQVPADFTNVGQFWGAWGMKPREFVKGVERDPYVKVRRVMIRLRDQKTGRKVPRPRGLQGLNVTGVDGKALAAQLVRWAESEAAG